MFDRMFDETFDGMLDGTFDGMIDGMLDGMFGGMFDGTFDGTFDGMFDGDGIFDGMFDELFDAIVNGMFDGIFAGTLAQRTMRTERTTDCQRYTLIQQGSRWSPSSPRRRTGPRGRSSNLRSTCLPRQILQRYLRRGRPRPGLRRPPPKPW